MNTIKNIIGFCFLLLLSSSLYGQKLKDDSTFKIGIWYECQTDTNMTIKIFRSGPDKVIGPDFTLVRIKEETDYPIYIGYNDFDEKVIIGFYSKNNIIFGTSTIEPYEVKCRPLGKRELKMKESK